MYLGGIIIIGISLAVTVAVVVAGLLFWRAGYFDNVEAPKYRMMEDEEGRGFARLCLGHPLGFLDQGDFAFYRGGCRFYARRDAGLWVGAAQRAVCRRGSCAACHSLEAGRTTVGPSLAGIGKTAATRVPGLSAGDYLRESIIAPNKFVVQGFPSGVMNPDFGQRLTPQQMDDLVAYLLNR